MNLRIVFLISIFLFKCTIADGEPITKAPSKQQTLPPIQSKSQPALKSEAIPNQANSKKPQQVQSKQSQQTTAPSKSKSEEVPNKPSAPSKPKPEEVPNKSSASVKPKAEVSNKPAAPAPVKPKVQQVSNKPSDSPKQKPEQIAKKSQAPPSTSSKLKQTSSKSRGSPNAKPEQVPNKSSTPASASPKPKSKQTPNKPSTPTSLFSVPKTQQFVFKMQPFSESYVIATIFNEQQQLIGIQNRHGRGSWIYIDQGAQEHKTCFDGALEMVPVGELPASEGGMEKPIPYCMPVAELKCMGQCKMIGPTTQKQVEMYKKVKGSMKYQLQLMSLNTKTSYTFLSAQIVTIQDEGIKNLAQNQISFSLQRTKQFYAAIVGQINVMQIQFLVIDHQSESEQYFFMKRVQGLGQFQSQNIIEIAKQNNPNNKDTFIKLSTMSQPISKKQFTLQPWFNSTMMYLGLPTSIRNTIRDHIIQQIFDNNCKQQQWRNDYVVQCKSEQIKKLTESSLQICLKEGLCVEIALADVFMIREESLESVQGQDDYYQYLYRIVAEDEGSVIKVYPQFAAVYKILLNHGQIVGFIRNKPQQSQHKPSQAKLNTKDHDHHQHIQPQSPDSTASAPSPSQTLPQKPIQISNILFDIFCLVSACIIVILGCKWLKSKTTQHSIQIQDWEDGILMDEEIGKNRKKIFQQIQKSTNQLGSPSSISMEDTDKIRKVQLV